MKIRAMLIVIGLASALGCAYKQGTLVTDELLGTFKKGITTKQDVVGSLGGPQDIKLEGEKTILIYKYQQINSFLPDVARDVTVVFQNDVLEDYMVSRGTSLPNPLTGR